MAFCKAYPLPISPPGLPVEPGFYDRDSLRQILGEELAASSNAPALPLSTFYGWLEVCLIAPSDWYQAAGALSDVEILIWYARWRQRRGKAKQFQQTLIQWLEKDEHQDCDREIEVQAQRI